MPHGASFVAAAFEDAGEVVVRVGVVGIELDRAAIRGCRIGETAEVVEGDAEIEGGDGMVGIDVERGAVMLRSRLQRVVVVKKTAEVYVGIDMRRIERDRFLVRGTR